MAFYHTYDHDNEIHDNFIRAYMYNDIETIKICMNTGYISNKLCTEAFHTACYYGYSDIVKFILDNSIITGNIFSTFRYEDYYLFYQACKIDDNSILKYLFEYMIKYNILDYYKNTPKYQEIFIRIFDIACEDKKLSIIKCIIDLYKKHNISFDIVRCSYNIIQLLCYYNPKNYNLQCDSDSEIVKYIIYLNKHNYNYTKYLYCKKSAVYITNGYKFSKYDFTQCPLYFFVCHKRNIFKYKYYRSNRFVINNNPVNYKYNTDVYIYLFDYVIFIDDE